MHHMQITPNKRTLNKCGEFISLDDVSVFFILLLLLSVYHLYIEFYICLIYKLFPVPRDHFVCVARQLKLDCRSCRCVLQSFVLKFRTCCSLIPV